MADIHIYTAGSEPRVYPEEGIADLLKSGELLPEMFYWREGMAEWEPLSKFQVRPPPAPQHESIVPPRRTEPLPDVSARLAAQPEPAPPVAAHGLTSHEVTGRVRFRLRKSPEPLTTIVQVLLILCICVAALELANAFVHYESMSAATPALIPSQDGGASTSGDGSSTAPDGTPIVADDADDVGWMLEYAGWVVNALLIVPYFMWVYRANQNCRHFSHIMRFKPKWAVGWYFIPIMRFFRPCQVMQEIWRVSNNPRTWHNDRSSILVFVWWVLTLATIELAAFNGGQSLRAVSHDDQVQVALVFIVLKVIQLAWYGTFIAMVSMIIKNQLRVVKSSRNKIEEEEEE